MPFCKKKKHCAVVTNLHCPSKGETLSEGSRKNSTSTRVKHRSKGFKVILLSYEPTDNFHYCSKITTAIHCISKMESTCNGCQVTSILEAMKRLALLRSQRQRVIM
ncbi:Uncharacterised protein r2_g1539 [Pycnogonum litorale]